MKTIRFTLLLLLFIPLVMSCSKPDITQYAENQPKFNLFEYFQGDTRGWGIVQDRNGVLLRQFVVDIVGTIDNDSLVLDEKFEWSDGEKSVRVWTIEQADANRFTGTAADVVGSAAGISSGNALNWNYYLNIEAKGRTWKIYLDDWMFLQEDDVLINKARMSKFGFGLGDITIVFKKKSI